MLAVTAAPFVVVFPQPPVFGRGAAMIVAAALILAMVGTCWQAAPAQRSRIMRRAAIVLAVTVAAVGLRIMAAGHVLSMPTPDLLPRLFGLQGEDIDDAVLYEIWLEVWLACASVAFAAAGLRRALRRRVVTRPATPGSWNLPVPPPVPPHRWSAATAGMFVIGVATLSGAILYGHGTAYFLSRSVHVTGVIADPQSHPIIRFTAADGAVVEFRQNGSVSRPIGADIPVAYQTEVPAGTAQADTFWANWSSVLGMVWIGLGFTAAPFFGYRAVMRGGR